MVVVGGLIVGFLVGRNIRPRLLMIIGMILMAVGFTLTATIHDNKPLLIIFAGIFGVGMGMGYASIPNLPHRGSAAAVAGNQRRAWLRSSRASSPQCFPSSLSQS